MSWQSERDFPAPPEGGAEGVGHAADGSDSPAASEQPGPVEGSADEILTDVVALAAQRDEYLGALQRSQADFANYRKRVQRLQEEQGSRATVELVNKLLPVLDNLDLAVAHLDKADTEAQPTTEGAALRQARTQLLDTLAKEGLERLDEEGVPFDPAVHDAVAHASQEEDEESDGARVDEVLRAGYRWRSQTLRPAMVRVRG